MERIISTSWEYDHKAYYWHLSRGFLVLSRYPETRIIAYMVHRVPPIAQFVRREGSYVWHCDKQLKKILQDARVSPKGLPEGIASDLELLLGNL